ncbi:DUF4962 domain-containing protein [Uliginosibacterium sp. sgz301328]|uniref:DUF4962 domain-containing protein n=1 Tax=Uliginosibacterium sp. sgz301328 TaxID=3243764 RepID=UPI00359D32FA
MKKLEQPQSADMTIKYFPEGITVTENPPRFLWLPELDSQARYAVRVVSDAGNETVFGDIQHNFFRPDVTLTPGSYTWSYALWDTAAGKVDSDWSAPRSFVLPADAPAVPGMRHKARYAECDMTHPRLWLSQSEATALGKSVAADPDHCKWANFMAKSVMPWMSREIIAEPLPYPNNKRTPALWRKMYIDCQEVIYAIRHLAIAGRVLGDAAMTARAKEWLLAVAAWDVRGPTCRDYNDEAAFRIVAALAWGYDWLHDELSDIERANVRESLTVRTREVANHVIDRAKIHIFPYDSHAVRSISSVLVPCSIVLLGEVPEAQKWLDYSIDFYDAIYPPWGGVDGGWAEGPHYWMTAMAYFTEAANLVLKYFKHDLYKRPFFQSTGWFPLYTKAPDTRRACFGDDSTLGDLPCLKVGYNLRQFAGVTGNPYFQWYFEEVCRNDPGTEMEFYNYGWWDLNFDDVQYLHDFPHIEAKAPSDIDTVKYFGDVGWVALQRHMDKPEQHIQFVTKASDFGSISHSHGDQGAFLLYGYGEDLAIQSGYYIGFGTTMHKEWRRLTKSKNAILIDGKGQYSGSNKAECLKAQGHVLEVGTRNGAHFISLDPTDAYKAEVPYLARYRRDIHFVHDRFFVIVDDVELEQDGSVQWLMHTFKPCELGSQVFRYHGDKAGLNGEFVYCSSGPVNIENTVSYANIDQSEVEGLPPQSTLVASTAAARHHTLVTLLTPYALSAPLRVFHFNDDQGFSTNLYFQDGNNEMYTITLPKPF